jgi:MYXO-CTERM domain-containing protein
MVLFSCLLALSGAAHATDTWTTVRSGVDLLHRVESGTQDIYAARVDLTVPNVGLHASTDSEGSERGVSTKTFAASADVLVAINADWSDGSTPVGLAIGDGWHWHNHIEDDTLGGTWGYFACTATKDCTIDAELPLDQAWWFASPTISPYRYFQAIGANGQLMLVDGVAQTGCWDSADNPRSAICLEADGTTLWLIVVDGRSSSADGMTCDETRALMLDLGCYQGAMLDGGGSSTLVVEGSVVNNPSDGSPRTVSNHLGIVYSDTIDAACTVSSGRWCDGTTISTCQGGRHLGSGDCAVYGASCEEDGDYAYCVDYRCPGGSGSGAECTDATNFVSCTDGQYGSGDCGAFGLVCGSDASGTACMQAECEAGPNSGFCTSEGLYGSCTAGIYSEVDCVAQGLECTDAGCAEPGSEGDGGTAGDGGGAASDGGAAAGDGGAGGTEATGTRIEEGGCGCSAAGATSGTGVVLLIVGVGVVGWRRRGGWGGGGYSK